MAWSLVTAPSVAANALPHVHRASGCQIAGVITVLAIMCFFMASLVAHHLAAVNGVALIAFVASLMLLRRTTQYLHVEHLPAQWGTACLILAFFAIPILFEPLTAWDARSIWFFHAKRIYFDDGLNLTRGWNNPEYGLTHPSYPKLLPMLAAEAAYLLRRWNEYVPKSSLLLLLMPIALALVSFARRGRLSAAFLVLLTLLTPGELLWTGMVDGYVAAYTAIAILFLVESLKSHDRIDVLSGVSYLGVALNLKNEGALILLCVACSFVALSTPDGGAKWKALVRDRLIWLAAGLPTATYFAWWLVRSQWGLHDDLLGGGLFARAAARLNANDLGRIADSLLFQPGLLWSVAILLLAMSMARWLKVRIIMRQVGFPVAVSVLYVVGLSLVYLVTPYSLEWHLQFSADRVMLLPTMAISIGTYLVLREIEASRVDATS